MTETIHPLIEDLIQAMKDRDSAAFQRASLRAWNEAQQYDADELTAAVDQLAALLGVLRGPFSRTAVLAGALVGRGASPLSLCAMLPPRATISMTLHRIFPIIWAQATNGRPLPDRDQPMEMGEVRRILVEDAERCGTSREDAEYIASSWFDLDNWLLPLITIMTRRDFRADMTHRDDVRDAALAIAEEVPIARAVYSLSLVLDDERLVALDPASGRGFQLTMSGIGDNHQLYTLLADRLIRPAAGPAEDVPGPGGQSGENGHSALLDGERPEPEWVAAATDGPPGPFPDTAPILPRFRLFDARGAYIRPEGRPADIPVFDRARIVVLHPPRGDAGWQNGRAYQQMVPELTLNRVLGPAETAQWLERIFPARGETDLPAQRD